MLDLIPKVYARDLPPPVTEDYCRFQVDWGNPELRALGCIFNRVYNAAVLSVGGVFVIWAILSGIRWATAAGDEKATAAARRSFTFAVLGFIIIISAHALIKSIGGWLGSPSLLPLNLPAPSP